MQMRTDGEYACRRDATDGQLADCNTTTAVVSACDAGPTVV
ncbi:hypothetical protein [Natrinema sp. HArc-T2]